MVDQRFWVKLLGTAGRVFESHLSASQRWSTSPLRSCTSPNKCAATTASMRTTKGRFDVWGAPGGLTPPELDPRHRADTQGPHRRPGSPLDPVDAAGPRRGAPRAPISSRTRSGALAGPRSSPLISSRGADLQQLHDRPPENRRYDLIDLTIRVKRKTEQKGIQKLNFQIWNDCSENSSSASAMASGRCYPDLSKLDAGQGRHRRAASTQAVRVSPRLGRRSWAAPATSRAPRTGTMLRAVRLRLNSIHDTGQVAADTQGPHRRPGSPLDPVDAAGPRRGAPRAPISSRTRSGAPAGPRSSPLISSRGADLR
jgi:hypothetical protein